MCLSNDLVFNTLLGFWHLTCLSLALDLWHLPFSSQLLDKFLNNLLPVSLPWHYWHWGQVILCSGELSSSALWTLPSGCLCHPLAPCPIVTTKNVSEYCQVSPGEHNHPQLGCGLEGKLSEAKPMLTWVFISLACPIGPLKYVELNFWLRWGWGYWARKGVNGHSANGRQAQLSQDVGTRGEDIQQVLFEGLSCHTEWAQTLCFRFVWLLLLPIWPPPKDCFPALEL